MLIYIFACILPNLAGHHLFVNQFVSIFNPNLRSLTSIAILTENIVLAQRPGLTGGSGSRGSLLEQLRYYARDAEGLAGRALSPIEMGRCANREFGSQCCAGSNWNCQAPGSKCSCDQVSIMP